MCDGHCLSSYSVGDMCYSLTCLPVSEYAGIVALKRSCQDIITQMFEYCLLVCRQSMVCGCMRGNLIVLLYTIAIYLYY